jgi:S1-C subfamily serine protease
MSTPTVRCPACSAIVSTGRGSDGRYWCTACDEVFEVLELSDADEVPVSRVTGRPKTRPSNRSRARREEPDHSSSRTVVLAVALGVLGLVGIGLAGYFVFKKDPPKETVEAPAPKVEPPKPELPKVQPPKKDEPPKKEEPKPPTHEEIVRRVKGATVYIRTSDGTGTGFFAGKPGFVVTNAHVIGYGPRQVRPAKRVEVVVASGEPGEKALPATVYGADVENDLALLQVEGSDLPAPLAFGKAADLIETQEVVIYGYPFGELLGKNISINRSTVSSLRKEGGKLVLVQLAGGLNPGNSGGPVTNTRGEVIGVSVAKLRGAETIAFAIPAEEATAFVKDQERTGGRFDYGTAVVVGPNPAIPPVRPPVRPPVKPPEPVGPPLDLPPVKPIPIAPADVAATGKEIKLPAEADQVCVGGGGRFLLASLPKVKQIAVFDFSEAKVVKYIPTPTEKVLIAAGMDKLVVVDPGNVVIQRWSLITFEKEATTPLPTTAGLKTTNIAMGSGSNGPLLVQGLDWPRLGEWYLFDVTTMKEVKGGPDRHGTLECRVGDKVRASNDGRTIVVNRPEGGVSILTMNGARWTQAPTPWRDRWPTFPSANGDTVYGMGDMCSPGGKRIGPAAGGQRYSVPAVHGPLVFAITDKADRHHTQRGFSLAVHAPRDTRPMFQLPTFEAIRSLFEPNRGWHIDSHVFFVPQAKVVAVLPRPADKIVLYKVDVDAELAKTDLDYLFVASQPPAVVRGQKFEYPIDAKSKKGDVKYKLDFGPDGLTVGADGKVTWGAPADFSKPVSVAVTISDKSGQEIIHTFELVPAAK